MEINVLVSSDDKATRNLSLKDFLDSSAEVLILKSTLLIEKFYDERFGVKTLDEALVEAYEKTHIPAIAVYSTGIIRPRLAATNWTKTCEEITDLAILLTRDAILSAGAFRLNGRMGMMDYVARVNTLAGNLPDNFNVLSTSYRYVEPTMDFREESTTLYQNNLKLYYKGLDLKVKL